MNSSSIHHAGGGSDMSHGNVPKEKDGFPMIAVEWMTLHCNSNVELAVLSNVCTSWRDVVCQSLGQVFVSSLKEGNGSGGQDVNRLLLPSMALDLMRRGRLNEKRSAQAIQDNEETFCLAWFAPDGIQFQGLCKDEKDELDDSSSSDSHNDCEHAMNITASSSAAPEFSHSKQYKEKEPFAPGGAPFYEGSEDDQPNIQPKDKTLKNKLPHRHNAFSSPPAVPLVQLKHSQSVHSSGIASGVSDAPGNSGILTCVYEWRGYRDATDVLIPLGYSTAFIWRVLDMAVNLLHNHHRSPHPTTNTDETASNNNSDILLETPSSSWTSEKYTRTTFAVRGATLARPENYCLCLDSLISSTGSNEPTDSQKIREDQHKRNEAETDKYRRHLYRLRHSRQKQRLRKKKQREMARLFLPRMVLSNKKKNPLIQLDSTWSTRSRCVQFLNANGTHAVFLRTLPFECGTVKGPITIFLVGVATEDGCFVSGLKRRCEIGHMYPTDARDMLIDMSPICIATDGDLRVGKNDSNDGGELSTKGTSIGSQGTMKDLWEGLIDDMNAVSTPNVPTTATANSNMIAFPTRKNSSYDSHDDSSDDSSENSEDNGLKILCSCPFQCQSNRNSAIYFSKQHHINGTCNEEEEPPPAEEEDIYRGKMGPGLWHCYTVVFDGEESMIRVDGMQEPLQNGWLQEKGDDMDEKEGNLNTMSHSSHSFPTSAASSQRGLATLDGLTIGSDHIFDMTLCCGDAADGEGDGAIAELVAFKGRMDLSDVDCIERYLMAKHGIPTVSSLNMTMNNNAANHSENSKQHTYPHSHWQEDEWKRQAHALIEQPPPWKIANQAVPLRVAANHRSVAWHRTNDVTGKVLRVPRIGSKKSTGSSDW